MNENESKHIKTCGVKQCWDENLQHQILTLKWKEISDQLSQHCLKKSEKEKQNKPREARKKHEIIKIEVGINEI